MLVSKFMIIFHFIMRLLLLMKWVEFVFV